MIRKIFQNLLLLSLVFSFLAPSCKKEDKQEEESINISLLKEQKWFFAGEETSGDTIYYRPETFDFPPSRGREAFQFKDENGKMTYYAISPTDFPMTHENATWSLDGDLMTLKIPGNEWVGDRTIQFRILKLDKEKLKGLAIY